MNSSNKNSSDLSFAFAIFLSVALLTACSKDEPADKSSAAAAKPAKKVSTEIAQMAYMNGRVYTVDKENSWARAIAVSNGKIVAVGSNAEIAKHVGDSTKVYNLHNKMLMPGIHDMRNIISSVLFLLLTQWMKS